MNLEEGKKLVDNAIMKAKDCVEADIYKEKGERKWVEVEIRLRDKDEYLVKLLVLEEGDDEKDNGDDEKNRKKERKLDGPKGFILADYNSGIVKVMSGSEKGMRVTRTLKSYKHGERLFV